MTTAKPPCRATVSGTLLDTKGCGLKGSFFVCVINMYQLTYILTTITINTMLLLLLPYYVVVVVVLGSPIWASLHSVEKERPFSTDKSDCIRIALRRPVQKES